MIARHVHEVVMEEAVRALRADPALAGVVVVAQNDQDLATLITVEEGRADGLVAVVAVDKAEKIHSNPARYRVDFSVDVTEVVPVNRETPGFRTAIDVAAYCGEAVEAACVGTFKSLDHTTPGDGILCAVAKCFGEYGRQ